MKERERAADGQGGRWEEVLQWEKRGISGTGVPRARLMAVHISHTRTQTSHMTALLASSSCKKPMSLPSCQCPSSPFLLSLFLAFLVPASAVARSDDADAGNSLSLSLCFRSGDRIPCCARPAPSVAATIMVYTTTTMTVAAVVAVASSRSACLVILQRLLLHFPSPLLIDSISFHLEDTIERVIAFHE